MPTISKRLLAWFTWYSRWYLRRHFHSVRISRRVSSPEGTLPLVIYSNHASWWDPLLGLILKDTFLPEHLVYSPMDATALNRYGFFRKLGFFPVEQGTARGARQFLRVAQAVLQNPSSILAITPQSRFADVRERPLRFHTGLGHLATRIDSAVFVPMAAEYVFWEERLPEILVRFGQPVEVSHHSKLNRNAVEWTALFEAQLTETMDALSLEARQREKESFEVLLCGGGGQGGIYDLWRAALARLRGQKFRKEHGHK